MGSPEKRLVRPLHHLCKEACLVKLDPSLDSLERRALLLAAFNYAGEATHKAASESFSGSDIAAAKDNPKEFDTPLKPPIIQ